VGGFQNQNQINSNINLSTKTKKHSKSRKRERPWLREIKKRENPYSSHPKTDHIRSKSSYVGPSSFKSIFQIYREAGVNGKNYKEIKMNKI